MVPPTTGAGARRLPRVLVALLAALLVVPIFPGASAAAAGVVIEPTQDGNTAVRSGQTIDVSGEAPEGQLIAARLIGLLEDGSSGGVQTINGAVLGTDDDPLRGGDYLKIEDGQFDGRLSLQCLFAPPNDSCRQRTAPSGVDIRDVVLELVVGEQTLRSAALRVDYTRPGIRDAAFVDVDRIVVRMTEPVRYPPLQPELGADWEVTVDGDEVPVTRVEGPTEDDCVGGYGPGEDERAGRTGCTRTLVLDTTLLGPIDEDAQPVVDYVLVDNRLPGRQDYSDFASNRLRFIGTGTRLAVDEIRPPTPTIDTVDGVAPPADGSIDGRQVAPVLAVSGLRAGHDVWVERVPATGEPVKGPEVRAEGETATVTAPTLPEDGEYVLRVVVRDPNGNLSTQSEKNAARADGSPSTVTYVLDRVAPFVVSAVVTTDGQLRVAFSESVAGTNDAAHWQVRDPDRAVTAVEGSGESRLLTVTDGAPAGGLLDYAPGESGRYADPAGNVVPDLVGLIIGGVPVPVVQVPAGPLVTSATSTTLSGAGGPGSTVQVYREGAPDTVLATALVDSSGAWSAAVALIADQRNDFRVRAVEDGLPPSGEGLVPPITQDGTKPALALLAPTGGEVLAGGAASEVEFSTSDANPGTVLAEIATDGKTFAPLGAVSAPAGAGAIGYEIPDVDTDDARVRLTATDLAGNTTVQLSDAFTIDAVPPVFTARTTAPRTVHVTFSEPVDGPVGRLTDWRVAGQPAAVESVDGSSSAPEQVENATVFVLRSSVDFDPDDTPEVTYAPSPAGQLTDDAEQGVPADDRVVEAVDGIRPAVPTITAVEGQAPEDGQVVGGDGQPSVSVSGLRADNVVYVERVPSAGEPVKGPEVRAEGETATATAPTLPEDGEYALRVVARDPAGNLSTDTGKTPGSADGGPSTVTYVLDRVVPSAVAAVVATDGKLRVSFSESVAGTNDPADWQVRDPDRAVTAVEGSGDTRVLAVTGGAPVGGFVDYAPGDSGRYADPAGNGVPDVTLRIGGVPVPVVKVPAGPLVTSTTSTTLSGTGGPGSTVQVYREGAPETVVATAPVDGSGAWSTAVALTGDQRNDFRVRAVDDGLPPSSEGVVPPITQDGTRPGLTLLAPTGGEVLAGGAATTVEFSTSDANPGTVLAELAIDGKTFQRLGSVSAPAGDGTIGYQVPDVDTDDARVRVTATDRAGNTTVRVSDVFIIDAGPPVFAALTTAARTVEITFSEPVDGPVGRLTDWRVAGQPAIVESVDGRSSAPEQVEDATVLVLRSSVDFGPDETPGVTYAPSPAGQLTDDADQGVPADGRVVEAVDGIRPAVPTITAVQGQAPEDGQVLGGDRRPSLSVSGLRADNVVYVERVPADGEPVAGPEVTTSGSTATVFAPLLREDGEHALRVVVRDPAGNLSTDTGKNPGSADGGPSTVTYVLDTLLPAIVFAVADNDRITVRFSEPVTGPNSAADWSVTERDGSPVLLANGNAVRVVAVNGSGDTRVLDATGARPGTFLVYRPGEERYVDANRNAVADTTTLLQSLAPPTVTSPSGPVLVTGESTLVRGTSEPGHTVSLFRDQNANGVPDGTAVTSTTVPSDETAFSLTAPLERDAANRFLVRATRPDGRNSLAVPVPVITQDSTAPVLRAPGLPVSRERLTGGDDFDVRWAVCDANLGARPIAIEYSLDDGARWTSLETALESPNDCTVETTERVTLPFSGSDQARLRVVATDLAGRTSSVVSPSFVLESSVRDIREFACPPDKVEPAGFVDTGGSTFRFEIDCLAAYGFTTGVTPDRYEPAWQVSRAQMALFVSRVATYAGVELDTRDAGFSDMQDEIPALRDAVNGLANAGVVRGKPDGTYAPRESISRAQMATFLTGLQKVVGTPFPAGGDAFDDDDGTAHEGNIDILAASGLVGGTGPRTYSPAGPVTRQQMAGFLMRYVDSRIEAGEMRSRY
jgi:hypothetical protein